MPDEEQSAAVGRDGAQRVKRIAGGEPTGQGRILVQGRTLLLTPALGGELSGAASAYLGAVEDLLEDHAQARHGHPGSPCLFFSSWGQLPLRVHTCAVGLGVGMT